MKSKPASITTLNDYGKQKKISGELAKLMTIIQSVEHLNSEPYCIGKYKTTVKSCSTCDKFLCFALPCRHIFILRRTKDFSEFDLQLDDPRQLL